MARRILRVPGAITVGDSWGGGSSVPPVVVGDPPQWDDDSDGTYAELETFEHPDVSYVDGANGDLTREAGVSTNSDLVKVFARVRYQCLAVDMGAPTVRINATTHTGSLLNGAAAGPGSQAPTWVEIPLAESQAGRMTAFLARANDTVGTLSIEVRPAFLRNYSYRYPRTRIYEAYVVVQTAAWTPPCRNIKRGDALDLGGARNYPPSKMQQTSSRGVGAY